MPGVDRVKVAIADDAGRASSALDLDAMVDISNPLEPGARRRLQEATHEGDDPPIVVLTSRA